MRTVKERPELGVRAGAQCGPALPLQRLAGISKLGVQRAVGLPECATPPQEVYELAKRRGMDFVTITDHDTVAGVLEIAERPDVFVSEELTAHFRGEPRAAVHVLCYGISGGGSRVAAGAPRRRRAVRRYLPAGARARVRALRAPLLHRRRPARHARHLRRLAELFAAWEVRNGARAPELNRPAAVYVATRDGIGIPGGSDDHAGTDIARTFTESPGASTPAEFLAHVRAGRVSAHGAQGSAAKWAHAAIALAVRSLLLADLAAEPWRRSARRASQRCARARRCG